MTEYTDDQLVQKYVELRDHVKARSDEFELAIKPAKDAMDTLENVFLERMNERGQTSFKTEHGTPYKSTLMAVKVADTVAFHKFIMDNQAVEFLPKSTVKESVADYVEKNKAPPPGIEITYITKVNIRRS